MFCEKCGNRLPENARFCTQCGTSVGSTQSQTTYQQPLQQQPTQNTENSTPSQFGAAEMGVNGMPVKASHSSSGNRKAVIIIVIVLSVILVAAAVVAFVLLGRRYDAPAEPIVTEQTEEAQKQQTQQEPEPEPEAPHEMTFEEAQQIAAGFSTSEFPDLTTFDWYTPSIGSNAVPGFLNSATPITNHTLVEGGWKMLVVWDPQRARNAYCWDIENAQIWNQGGDSVSMNVTPYIFYEPDLGYTTDISNQPAASYLGNWMYDTFHVTVGYTDIDINYFYEYDGKQYAVGTIVAPDGTTGEVALVRP